MHDRKPILRAAGLFLVTTMALAACARPDAQPGAPGAPGAPQQAGKPALGGELAQRAISDPDTFAFFWRTSKYAADILDRVYGGGLLGVGMDYTPEPALAAELPAISEDGLTYTFRIREGIRFHDGEEVTAEDFKLSYDILMSPDYAGPFKSAVTQIAAVEVVDTYTLQITTTEVFAPFLFSSASIPPMPAHIMGDIPVRDLQAHNVWNSPVGAGPYRFVEWRSGQYTLLERFPDYYESGEEGVGGGQIGPWIERIRFKIIPDDNTAKAAFEAGELHVLQSIDEETASRYRHDLTDRVNIYEWNRMGFGYQTFNNDRFPTNIKEVRQALSHGLNREAIVQGLLNGAGSIPPGFVPPIHWTFDATLQGYEYSKERAIALMEQAGFTRNARGGWTRDGQEAVLKYVATAGSPVVEGIALASKQMWDDIGFRVDISMVDFNTLLDRHLKPGDFHVTFSGLSFTIDPHTSFYGYHSENIRLDAAGNAQGANRSRYSNPEVDRLIDQGRQTVDVNERKRIYQEAQRMIVDDAVNNWLYVNVWTDAVHKTVKGVVNWDGFGTDLAFVPQWYINEEAAAD